MDSLDEPLSSGLRRLEKPPTHLKGWSEVSFPVPDLAQDLRQVPAGLDHQLDLTPQPIEQGSHLEVDFSQDLLDMLLIPGGEPESQRDQGMALQ
jgi:hypothetical protein